jgi:hypothetical protein
MRARERMVVADRALVEQGSDLLRHLWRAVEPLERDDVVDLGALAHAAPAEQLVENEPELEWGGRTLDRQLERARHDAPAVEVAQALARADRRRARPSSRSPRIDREALDASGDRATAGGDDQEVEALDAVGRRDLGDECSKRSTAPTRRLTSRRSSRRSDRPEASRLAFPNGTYSHAGWYTCRPSTSNTVTSPASPNGGRAGWRRAFPHPTAD